MNKNGLAITIVTCCVVVLLGVVAIGVISGLNGNGTATEVIGPTEEPKEKIFDGFKYSVENNRVTILSSEKGGTNLEIPSEIEGMPVVKIAANAFVERLFKTVKIPDSVEVIEQSAFCDCDLLTELILPASLKVIERGAFSYCGELTTVTFNNQLEELGESAFASCRKLTDIKLPNSVKVIGDKCFQRCKSLESLVCPEELTQIGEYAFGSCSKIKSIVFNEKLSKIEKGAFAGNDELTSVNIPNSIKTLGDRVFYECKKLEDVVLPKDLKMIPVRAFQYCTELKKITLPEKIIIIKKAAFSDCTNLEKVIFNDKLIAIGDQAFSANKKMKEIILKDRVRFIGNGAFRDTLIEKIKLSKNLAYIGNGVFTRCSQIKVINIPAKVKGINKGAFKECKALTAINVAPENQYYSSIGGVLYDKNQKVLLTYPANKNATTYTSPVGMRKIRAHSLRGNQYLQTINVSAKKIKRYAFAQMKNLKSVTINGNDTIEVRAFFDNDALQTVTINENRVIGSTAFADCEKLKTVNIVKAYIINENAFEDCDRLTFVELPEGLRKIKAYAFWGSNLRTINIPSSVTVIGSAVFGNNMNLVAFTGGSPAYLVEDGILYNGNRTVLIKYPSQKRGNIFDIPDSVVRVKGNAFEKNLYLKTLYMGSNCNTLENYAITKCNKLKTIMFYTTQIKKVSRNAFSGCKNLSIVVGPNNNGLKLATEAVEASFISCM